MGLNREAEMIEQQLKAKQVGQPTAASVVPGKHFVIRNEILRCKLQSFN